MMTIHYLEGHLTADNVRVTSKASPIKRKSFNSWINKVFKEVEKSRL